MDGQQEKVTEETVSVYLRQAAASRSSPCSWQIFDPLLIRQAGPEDIAITCTSVLA